MKKIMVFIFLISTGCSTVDVGQYSGNQPKFDLYHYFQGATTGWGIVQDRHGRLTRQFIVTIDGSVDAKGTLTLREDFRWNDGEISQRVWSIESPQAMHYQGTAGDVVGVAKGRAAGNALAWKYVLNVEVDGRKWKVDFDDWMFLQPDGILINRTELSKFGFHLGDVTIAFRKEENAAKEKR